MYEKIQDQGVEWKIRKKIQILCDNATKVKLSIELDLDVFVDTINEVKEYFNVDTIVICKDHVFMLRELEPLLYFPKSDTLWKQKEEITE